MEPRPDSPILHSARKPRLPWRTSHDWSGRLSTASKAFAIRFDAGRDRASRLRAFDHDYTHIQPPCFSFAFSFAAERQVADRLDCTSPRGGSSLQPIQTASLVRLIQVTFCRTLATLIGSAVSIAAF
jgi:hypothetical protein